MGDVQEGDIVGYQARSKEGRGLSVRGGDSDKWITIQKNTFTNWVNIQIQGTGLTVTDLQEDFCDGVKLCALVAALQEKKSVGRVIKKPMNQHQHLENVTLALNAIAQDNIRLVNIGSEDIVKGSLKLILGLIWHLILRYQIGKSKLPAKKLMIAWLQAVVPDGRITNFTSDWNDGVNLHAVIDYCQPGLCPNWRQLSRHNRLENCRNAMTIAKDKFGIPLVVRPEDLSSPHLDELSGMTYLSYFMNIDSPGYQATLRNVSALLTQGTIKDFTSSWNDGSQLCNLTKSLGQNPGPTTADHMDNLKRGIEAGRRLGVEPLISAKEMNEADKEHIGVMAYAAYFTHLKPVKSLADKAIIDGNFQSVYVGQEKRFTLTIDDDVDPGDFRAEVLGPDSIPPVRLNWSGRTATGSFTPSEMGQHRLNVYCRNENLNSCPIPFKVSSDRSKVNFYPVDKCPVGVITELKVDTSSAGQGDVRMEVETPSGRTMNLPVAYRSGVYTANFTPAEVGDHRVTVQYDNEHISGSPFIVKAYDPSNVRVFGLEGGSVGKALSFTADSQQAGEGELTCQVQYQGKSVPSYLANQQNNVHNVEFTPQGAGIYKISMYYNNVEIRGSPYTLEIVDSSMVSVSGDGLSLVPVNKTASFNVQTRGAGGGNITCDVTSPSGKSVTSRVVHKGGGIAEVEYTPHETGDYQVYVLCNGEHIKGSPFVCKVYDVGSVVVSNMPQYSPPDKPVMFDIDASHAGSGNIEIRVNEGRVACSVENRGNHQFKASFTPENTRPHRVEMTFNETQVDDSPWVVSIIDPNSIKVSGTGLHRATVGRRASFALNSTDVGVVSDIDVNITAPDGDNCPCDLETDSGGTMIYKYVPRQVGNHTIRVMVSGTEVADSPFVAKAYDTSAITVTYPPDGFVSQPIQFGIDVSKAGEGQLQIMVNSGNLPNEVEMEQSGVYKISFTPQEPGQQVVDISFNEEALPVSPLTCNAVDLSATVTEIPTMQVVNCESQFLIRSAASADVSSAVSITAPSGQQIPARIMGNGSGGYSVEYTPREIGTYVVKASLSGVEIKGSPFRVKTYDPNLVKVSKMPDGVVGTPTKFIVDASAAGEGTLELAISANGRNIPNQARALGGGRFEVSFVGREPTKHKAVITYNGEHVPGSPFWINFLDASHISATGDGLSLVPCHRATHFTVHATGAALPDLNIKLTAPDGREVPIRIRDPKGDQNYRIEWTPTMIGDHKAVIEYADMPIKGSPFTVKAFDAANVRVSKIPQGFLGRANSFTLDASEAGDGNLEIQVTADGDSVPNYVRQDSDTNFRVNFTPQRPSQHLISVKFNGEPVPGSPFVCPVLDSDRIHVSGEGLKMVPANMLASFKVDPKGAGEGDLNVRVYAPNGHEIPARLSGSSHSAYRVDYTPHDIGQHVVHVEYGGVEVKGSPFTVNVFDPSLIRVNTPGKAYLGHPVHIQIDTSAAGSGELEAEVTCRGTSVASHIREIGRHRYEMSFTPHDLSTHMVSLLFNNIPLTGSPYPLDVIDSNSVTLSGEGLRIAKVYKETWFNLDLHGMDENDLDVHITSPSGNEIPCRLSRKGHVCRAEYTPLEVGQHVIDVFFAGNRLHGSPYVSQAYDPSLVRITDIDKTAKKEREIAFIVDASAAGVGDLDAMVTHHGRSVHTYRETIGDGRYRYTFTPTETGHYDLNVKFNDDLIPGCPVIVNVEEEVPTFITINFRGMEALNVRDRNHFILHMDGRQIDMDALHVRIKAPSGEQVPAQLVRQPDGDYRVEWTPNMAGRHSVDVLFAGQQIQGSPFFINVFDINKIRVDNFYNGNVGETAGFNVDCTQAGKADHLVRVVSPSGRNVPIDIQEQRVNEYAVSYTPQEVGRHKIHLTYGTMEHPGSPFTQEIGEGALPTAHGDGLYRGEEDKPATFFVEASGMVGEPTIQVDGYSSVSELMASENRLDVDVNEHVGMHLSETHTFVNITESGVILDGRDGIENKHVDANQEKLYKIGEVEATDAEMRQYEINEYGQEIDGRDYKMYKLGEIEATDENMRQYEIDEFGNEIIGGRHNKMYRVSEVNDDVETTSMIIKMEEDNHGVLNAAVSSFQSTTITSRNVECNEIAVQTDGEYDFENSAMYLRSSREVTANRYERSREISRSGEVTLQTVVESETQTDIGMQEMKMLYVSSGKQLRTTEWVEGPNSIAKCSIDPQPGGRFAVTYVPVEVGLFDVTVKWNGREIHGSPFHPRIVDARKVRVIGGWQHYMDAQERVSLHVGEEKQIPFETADAGPGKLTAEVRGPSGALVPCTVDDSIIGKSTVIFTPRDEGNHFIHLNWADHPVSGSPFTGYAVGGYHDISKIILSGRGLKEATVREEAEFFIDGSKAGRGEPEVQLTGVRAEVNVIVTPMGGGKYRCTYIPVIPGAYLLHIVWNGRQVKGAPFKVNVIGAFYPNKVMVSGEGLKGGLMGRDLDIRIDTRKAGPGELTAFCSGPNKVAYCHLEDNRDGTFRLTCRPTEPGRHVLQVKYGGEHVLGSPFVFRVSAQPDASKVRVSGPGVEHGILATFQSRFIVETRGAGAGQLMVRIRGPKGAFQVEMYRDSQKDRTILCRYDPAETGLYIIHVRWSNVDVPGSPFHVHIVDTQQELEQVLNDQSYSSSTLPSHRSYSQWREEF